MGFLKSLRFATLFLLFGVLLGILVQVDDSLALKCYHCRKKNTDNKKKHNIRCDPENRGELQTCVFDNEMCYKFIITKYNQKLEDNGNGKGSLPGESPHKGCGPFLRPNHTMGCQRWNEFNDICYCDEDRCNTHEHPKDLPY